MKIKNSIVSNTILLSLGIIIPKVLMMLMLPIYTFYLTKTEYGIYDLAMNITTLIIPILTLQIPSGVFRMLLNNKNSKEVISSASLIILFASIISTLVFIVVAIPYGSIKYLFALYVLSTVLFQLLLEICRGLNHKKEYVTASIINSILIVAISLLFLTVFKLNLLGLVLAILISQLLADIYLMIKIKFPSFISKKEITKECMNDLLKYSLPLIPNTLSWWIVNLSDRLLISFFLGIEYNAIYAISNKIPSIYSLFYNAFNLSWQEDATINYEKNDRSEYYSMIFNNLLTILFYGLVILIGIVPLIFKILVNSNYSDSYNQMPILCISLLFSSIATFFGGIYIAQKETKKLGTSTIIAAVINIIINLLLINKLGLYAASISTLCSYLAICIYRFVDIKKSINITVNYKKYLIFIPAIILMIIIFYKKYIIISTIISLILSILFIKKYIIKKIKKVRK